MYSLTVNITKIILLFLSVFLFSQHKSVLAEVYKWTDEDGRIHYGDRPDGKNPQQININETNPNSGENIDRMEKRQRLLNVLDEERQQRDEMKAEEKIAEQKRQANCDKAKTYLQSAVNSSFLYEDTGDPLNPKILTNEERKNAIDKAEDDVKTWC